MMFAGLPDLQWLATFYLAIWLMIMAIFVYLRFYRGMIGPITHRGEFLEQMAKEGVLDQHGLRPARTRKRLWGLFEYNVDEMELGDED